MNIVIVGVGKVGYALAEELSREEHDITMIDSNEELLRNAAERLDIIYVAGNGTALSVQTEANVNKADLMIAATSSDEVNMLCCLLARKIGCKYTIARVRNPEYEKQLYMMKDDLGLSMFINPELATAVEISRLITYPAAISVSSFVSGRVDLIEIKVAPDSCLVGLTLAALRAKYPINILICAVERGEDVFIPRGDFVIEVGDSIHISGDSKHIVEFLRAVDNLGRKVKGSIIIGGGRISYYLSRLLLEMGVGVRIIEKDRDRCEELSRILPSALIIEGDGTSRELLEEEGIVATDSFITLTDMDEENLIMSMHAVKQGVPKVITKLNRLSYLDVVTGMGIDSVVSPKYITAYQIVQYVRAMQNRSGNQVHALYRIADDRVEAAEFIVSAKTLNVGRQLKDFKVCKNTLIAAIVHEGHVMIPHGDNAFQLGDSVVVVTTADEPLIDLNEIFI